MLLIPQFISLCPQTVKEHVEFNDQFLKIISMKNEYSVLKRTGSDIITQKNLRINAILDYHINTTALFGSGKCFLFLQHLVLSHSITSNFCSTVSQERPAEIQK